MKRFCLPVLALALLAVPALFPLSIARAEPSACLPLRPGAEQVDPAREYGFAAALQHGACGFKVDKRAAAGWYRKAALQGDSKAQYALAEMYFDGDGVPLDYPEAKKWYLKAATQGDGPSELRLAFLYAEKHFKGVTADYAVAEKWFLKAAEQNTGDAQFRLGNFYLNYKRPPDNAAGAAWLKKAAEGGNRTAMFDYGRLQIEGTRTAKDNKQGLDWIKKSAGLGVLEAEMALVRIYSEGTDARKDPMEALHWNLKIAAEPAAPLFYLDRAGDALFDGKNALPQNYPAARQYYERAAARGDTHALQRLAAIYNDGLGVEKDPAKAAAYKARATGH